MCPSDIATFFVYSFRDSEYSHSLKRRKKTLKENKKKKNTGKNVTMEEYPVEQEYPKKSTLKGLLFLHKYSHIYKHKSKNIHCDIHYLHSGNHFLVIFSITKQNKILWFLSSSFSTFQFLILLKIFDRILQEFFF